MAPRTRVLFLLAMLSAAGAAADGHPWRVFGRSSEPRQTAAALERARERDRRVASGAFFPSSLGCCESVIYDC